ncbi:unnamed protein product [Ilex paraguariensis]|uniref:Uncharacterized protein n=1 Tax=Ilex paraguariensis TaxID=185542 RepID=A0ABC8RQ82_9AQUA
MDKKNLAAGDMGSKPIRTHPNSYETVPKVAAEIQKKPEQDLRQSIHNIFDKSASPHVLASACKAASAVRLDTLLPVEGFVQSRSLVCTDQSSEDQVDGHIEREEWLESSPGFDVLVDDGSKNLNEDDPEHLLDREGRELNGRFLGYDFDDHIENDPIYPDARMLYEQDIHDSYDLLDDESTYDDVRKYPMHSRERMLDRIPPQKRKFLPMGQSFNGWSGMDLRGHLQKRRLIDVHSGQDLSRRLSSSHPSGQSKEKPRQQGTGRLHGRLASQVESNNFESHFENEAVFNGDNQRHRSIHSCVNRSKQHFKEKRQGKQFFPSSEVPRKEASKKRSPEEYTLFTAPKTLAQIKEEKRKALENGDSFGSEDFQGPKSLSEILKDKSRLCAAIGGNNGNSLLEIDHYQHE